MNLSEVSVDYKNFNEFLYKLLSVNILFNLFFFYTEINIYISLIFYSFSIFLSLIFFSKIYKNYIFCFFAQILILFFLNLTYLNFILSVIINNFFLKNDFNTLIKFNFYCDLKTYFFANVYLCLFLIMINYFNSFIKLDLIKKLVDRIKSQNLRLDKKKNFILIIFCMIVEFTYFFSGTLGSQVSGAFILGDKNDSATWFTHFYYFLVTFHLLLNLLYIKNKNKSFFDKTFLVFSFLANFIFYGFFMRRMAVQFMFLAIITFFILSEVKIRKIRFFVINVLLISLLFQFTNFLQLIRVSEVYSVGKSQNLKEIVLEGKILDYFTNEDIRKTAQDISIKNFSIRLLNNHELATIFFYEKNSKKKYLNGELLRNNIIETIPQIIFPGKINYPTSDLLISSITNSPLYDMDTVDSFHSYSYIDFGFFGLIIYPALIVLMLLFFYYLMNINYLNNITVIFVMILFLPMYSLRITEINISDWFVIIRNIILFILIFNFLLRSNANELIK